MAAVDVGYGQLDWRLRNDPRVTVLERTNARYLTCERLPFQPSFVTADVSFISLTVALGAVLECARAGYRGLVLVKPQFEAGREHVGKGGVVRDREVHLGVLLRGRVGSGGVAHLPRTGGSGRAGGRPWLSHCAASPCSRTSSPAPR